MTLHKITHHRPQPLFASSAARGMEAAAARHLPPHTLMQRAGLSVARLAMAWAPHARTVWIACGPGNNGGDGLEAAMHLHQAGLRVVVTWLGDPRTAPADTRASFLRAQAAGVSAGLSPPEGLSAQDLCIDALLGLGKQRPAEGALADWIARMNASDAPTLAVDLPTGLDSDTGQSAIDLIADNTYSARAGVQIEAQVTLSLLCLKPGMFTGRGRDCTGEIWLDDLGVAPAPQPTAWLGAESASPVRPHASHKGSFGDVAVLGGSAGMAGAGVLAAQAALYGGAGRVFWCPLSGELPAWVPGQPEIMIRAAAALNFSRLTVVIGCGGGDAVQGMLPAALSQAPQLVVDADALNAIARDTQLQQLLAARERRSEQQTVITPHPLEAARLLGCTTAQIQADRLQAAQRLADRFGCTVVLKGSGTIVAAADVPPVINPTGNSRLATGGTGDVLAGMVGARLAAGESAWKSATSAVFVHGKTADQWPADQPFSAGALVVGGWAC